MSINPTTEIEALAYRLWEEDGWPTGRDLDHWFRAEAQVLARTTHLSVAPEADLYSKNVRQSSAEKSAKPKVRTKKA